MNKVTVNLGGKERTLKFTMLTQELYEKLCIQYFTPDDVQAMSANEQTIGQTGLASAIVIYAGLKAYADLTQTKPDFTLEDCVDWSEELIINNDEQVLQSIFSTWTESAAYKSRVELKKKLEQMESQQIGTQLEDTPLALSGSGQPISTS